MNNKNTEQKQESQITSQHFSLIQISFMFDLFRNDNWQAFSLGKVITLACNLQTPTKISKHRHMHDRIIE